MGFKQRFLVIAKRLKSFLIKCLHNLKRFRPSVFLFITSFILIFESGLTLVSSDFAFSSFSKKVSSSLRSNNGSVMCTIEISSEEIQEATNFQSSFISYFQPAFFKRYSYKASPLCLAGSINYETRISNSINVLKASSFNQSELFVGYTNFALLYDNPQISQDTSNEMQIYISESLALLLMEDGDFQEMSDLIGKDYSFGTNKTFRIKNIVDSKTGYGLYYSNYNPSFCIVPSISFLDSISIQYPLTLDEYENAEILKVILTKYNVRSYSYNFLLNSTKVDNKLVGCFKSFFLTNELRYYNIAIISSAGACFAITFIFLFIKKRFKAFIYWPSWIMEGAFSTILILIIYSLINIFGNFGLFSKTAMLLMCVIAILLTFVSVVIKITRQNQIEIK